MLCHSQKQWGIQSCLLLELSLGAIEGSCTFWMSCTFTTTSKPSHPGIGSLTETSEEAAGGDEVKSFDDLTHEYDFNTYNIASMSGTFLRGNHSASCAFTVNHIHQRGKRERVWQTSRQRVETCRYFQYRMCLSSPHLQLPLPKRPPFSLLVIIQARDKTNN